MKDSININRINALALVHGDMWWDPATGTAHCKFPPDSKKNVGFAAALWLSGYDNAGKLHVAAQTYRQDGNDHWPGPLDAPGTLSYATSAKWAKIWKVRRSDITTFMATTPHTVANTPAAILTWPAKGNSNAKGKDDAPLTITTDMAPFVDLNGDGNYQPLNGEYPDIEGDMALWWVFSDNGPRHDNTNGLPLGAEVHVMAYAYSRNTLIDYVVYYEYTIVNRSANNYHDVRMALWNDGDMGYYMDDFIAFDPARRLGIIYNGTNDDGGSAGHPENSYGADPPAMGVTIVAQPGDGPGTYVPAGSFTYYNNDPSIIGNPVVDTEYNNYMRGKIRNGAAFAIPWGSWNECTTGNTPGDRREILATNDFVLNAGAKAKVVLALVVDSVAKGCPSITFDGIKKITDTAWNIYHTYVDVDEAIPRYGTMRLYPNPVENILHMTSDMPGKMQVTIHDAVGRQIRYVADMNATDAVLDVHDLAPGTYVVTCRAGDRVERAVFVKQ
ncbi:hypothetical protein GCM10023093_12230 [Nemorincola caseinilytica]|uniref:Secretion system C-terminal sorting domain-containing protein n=1 Tax=Nemorincola caseinilytica TaxID=2054315 RepID=A0ABP8N9C7_9BACT